MIAVQANFSRPLELLLGVIEALAKRMAHELDDASNLKECSAHLLQGRRLAIESIAA